MEETSHFSRLTVRGKQFGKLFYWLEKRKLKEHYELMVLNGYDNLHELLLQVKTPIHLSSTELRAIGINKAADRYKILISLVRASKGYK